MQICASRFGSLAERIDTSPPLPEGVDSCTFSTGKKGFLTVQYTALDGAEQLLHSMYDPPGEAKKLIKTLWKETTRIFIVMGLGCAYHLKALQEHLRDEQRVLVIDTDLSFVREVFMRISCADIFADERFTFVVEKNKAIREAIVAYYINECIEYNTDTVYVDFVPLYERIERFHAFVRETKEHITQTIEHVACLREEAIKNINYLRTSGLGKRFFGPFKECLEYFKNRAAEGDVLKDADVGLLLTYLMFSYYSYSETFNQGSRSGC